MRERAESFGGTLDADPTGDALIAPAVTRRLIEDFAARPDPEGAGDLIGSLTEREREVLAEIGTPS